jgi:hypothetical protein
MATQAWNIKSNYDLRVQIFLDRWRGAPQKIMTSIVFRKWWWLCCFWVASATVCWSISAAPTTGRGLSHEEDKTSAHAMFPISQSASRIPDRKAITAGTVVASEGSHQAIARRQVNATSDSVRSKQKGPCRATATDDGHSPANIRPNNTILAPFILLLSMLMPNAALRKTASPTMGQRSTLACSHIQET